MLSYFLSDVTGGGTSLVFKAKLHDKADLHANYDSATFIRQVSGLNVLFHMHSFGLIKPSSSNNLSWSSLSLIPYVGAVYPFSSIPFHRVYNSLFWEQELGFKSFLQSNHPATSRSTACIASLTQTPQMPVATEEACEPADPRGFGPYYGCMLCSPFPRELPGDGCLSWC